MEKFDKINLLLSLQNFAITFIHESQAEVPLIKKITPILGNVAVTLVSKSVFT